MLDLDYAEDSAAETDANFVITGSGGIVEVQGTAEGKPFSEEEFLACCASPRPGVARSSSSRRQRAWPAEHRHARRQLDGNVWSSRP